jgi:peptidoglycan/xylan/chitin deacetylase (PgdA/CDA1 family)
VGTGVSDTLVLCYHALSWQWQASLSVTPASFEAQLRTLLERGYRATTFHQAVMGPPVPRTLAVTFDDAYRSVIDLAFPLLSRLEMTATVFVPTRFAETASAMSWPGIDHWLGGNHEEELGCMSWDELGELDKAGWEIGSHTHTHPYLPTLDDEALMQELQESYEICSERLRKRCRSLAYPFGAYDDRVVAAAGRAGYAAAGTLPARIHKPSPLSWPRIGIYHGDTGLSFRAKVSPTMRLLRGSPAWSGIEAGLRGFRRTTDRQAGTGATAGGT